MYRNDEGPTEEGVGCVFVPAFILLCALLIWSLGCVPAQASEEPPCAPGLIHYLPYCLTEAEYVALTAPPPPSIVPAPVYGPQEALVRTIAIYFWPDWAAERMVRIAECESGFVASAVNSRSGAAGIWQVMPFWQKPWPGDYLNAWTNGAVAYQIWLVQGFAAWVCTGHG